MQQQLDTSIPEHLCNLEHSNSDTILKSGQVGGIVDRVMDRQTSLHGVMERQTNPNYDSYSDSDIKSGPLKALSLSLGLEIGNGRKTAQLGESCDISLKDKDIKIGSLNDSIEEQDNLNKH